MAEKTPKTVAPPQPQKYRMPAVSLGPCVWMPEPNGEKHAAVITRVDKNTVHLAILPTESRALAPRSSVRHASDPAVAKMLDKEAGVWDFTEESKAIQRLVRDFAGAGG